MPSMRHGEGGAVVRRKIGDLVQKLEDAGVEINKIEWKGDNIDIDCSPYELGIEVFKQMGWLEDSE